MDEQTRKKLNRIQELERAIADAERELSEILNPEKVVSPPSNFSWNDEIVKIIQNHPEGIETEGILKEIKNSFPEYTYSRLQLNSALIYLVNRKKSVIRVGRATYKLTEIVS